jgi:uncharacterized protein YbbC (DUF1343 family)
MSAARVRTGLDRLLADPALLAGRRYGLLAHGASVSGDLEPVHRALARRAGPPAALFGAEHGYYAIEQDMISADGGVDPWTGAPLVSLYGDGAETLKPRPEAFAGLDLLIVDLQDVGSRYYTFAATAVWAAEVAIGLGVPVWVLDRPNPIGGSVVEGGSIDEGFHSFVGAFRTPVRHGLTLAELVRLEARRRSWPEEAVSIWEMAGWRRAMAFEETGLPWIAPSPNMPTTTTAWIYPGGCLIEATELSEGRGTTRPFQLVGAPGIEPLALADHLASRQLPGVSFLPTYFKPQFQKHRGEACGGVEVVVTDRAAFRSYLTGVELLAAFKAVAGDRFDWRTAPYEFVADRPAIDLLTGSAACREAIDGVSGLDGWIDGWAADEAAFRDERDAILLYREEA